MRIRNPQSAIRSQRGQAIIEFLLTVPVLLLVIFLIVTFGKGWRLNQRAVVAARHASWHIAEGQSVEMAQDPDEFQQDFFYGDPTSGHSGVGSPNDGKDDFEDLLGLPSGPATDYWAYGATRASGEVRQRAGVRYVPPGALYRYTLQDLEESATRDGQSWHYYDVYLWRFFGDRIMDSPARRRGEVMDAFDQAAQAGLSTVSDPVLYQVLRNDMNRHRRRTDGYLGEWIGSWRRG